jgi:hypothetical protein
LTCLTRDDNLGYLNENEVLLACDCRAAAVHTAKFWFAAISIIIIYHHHL